MDEYSNENNRRILEYISENPGCHLRQIKRELDLAMGTIQYHLKTLQKQGKISSEKQNFYKYYFPMGLFEKNERKILQILNQETAREILLSILEKKNPTQTDIANFMNLSSPTINWQITRLIELGLIVTIRDRKFKRYSFGIDTKYIISLMKSYHPTIWNKWSNRLAETFLSLSREDNN